MQKKLKFLLINPPIYDFSAYDTWAKPLGLLYISNILKSFGHQTILIDCMDRNLQNVVTKNLDGTGKFFYEIVEKPKVLKNIPLYFKRYGSSKDYIRKQIFLHKDADYVLITSIMTYWYLGVKEIVSLINETVPKTKIILGGILPILLSKFVKNMFKYENIYFYSSSTLSNFLDFVLGKNLQHKKFDEFMNYPEPDFSFYQHAPYVVLRTSYGCFYNCDYCSCSSIIDKYKTKEETQIVTEIVSLYQKTKTQNFVFYDDALFDLSTERFKKIFLKLSELKLPIKFYTPNGINPKFINKKVAQLMFDLNFIDPRLSLETVNDNIHHIIDKKIDLRSFESGLNNLILAGFKPYQISVYILAGLPQEKIDDVYNNINFLSKYGVKIRLCELSVVPKSKIFYDYGLDDNVDPLLYNNTIFLFNGIPGKIKPWCNYEQIQKLKLYVKSINNKNKEQLCSTHTHTCLTKN